MSEVSGGSEDQHELSDAELAARKEGPATQDYLYEATLAARSRLLTARLSERYQVVEEADPAPQPELSEQA